jgi:hypothetical protein
MTFEEDGTWNLLVRWLTLFVKFCFHCAWVMPAYALSSYKEHTVPFIVLVHKYCHLGIHFIFIHLLTLLLNQNCSLVW